MTDKQNYFTYTDNTSDSNDKIIESLHKQIIIDGVDVSGCKYYFDEKCRCMDASIMQDFYLCPQCNSNPNCYYKQLKCKEQECERLKKEINGYKTIIEKIRQEVQEDVTCESRECGCDSYEECIECLKNTILNIIYEERNDFNNSEKHLEEYAELLQQLDQLKAENRELKAVHSTNVALSDELFKYKAEIEELKHQIEDVDTLCNEKESLIDKYLQTLADIKEIVEEMKNFYEELGKCEGLVVVQSEQILQKISECEVGDV